MDQIEYLGASGSVLSYNLYSYCENNPVCLFDKDGTDAKLVLDYNMGRGGFIIVGHMALAVQKSKENWYLIEFTGGNKKDAHIKITDVGKDYGTNQGFKKTLLSFFGLGGLKTLYIEGDFTRSLRYAQRYENKDYRKYNLFFNNCLHFVKVALRLGKCSNPLLELYFSNSTTIIPSVFFYNATVISNMRVTILNKNRIKRGYYA